ncbi:hypothetical protein ASG01_06760 [Chryseobacterium sp. Leaf180]|nr:hypothetical protein ASG01_06760 [Chryseobacterium sp. Leaf180]
MLLYEKKPVVRNEEFVFSELIIDLLKFILIILIVQFKLKDILYCVVIAFLIFVCGMFIPHHIIKFN